MSPFKLALVLSIVISIVVISILRVMVLRCERKHAIDKFLKEHESYVDREYVIKLLNYSYGTFWKMFFKLNCWTYDDFFFDGLSRMVYWLFTSIVEVANEQEQVKLKRPIDTICYRNDVKRYYLKTSNTNKTMDDWRIMDTTISPWNIGS